VLEIACDVVKGNKQEVSLTGKSLIKEKKLSGINFVTGSVV